MPRVLYRCSFACDAQALSNTEATNNSAITANAKRECRLVVGGSRSGKLDCFRCLSSGSLPGRLVCVVSAVVVGGECVWGIPVQDGAIYIHILAQYSFSFRRRIPNLSSTRLLCRLEALG